MFNKLRYKIVRKYLDQIIDFCKRRSEEELAEAKTSKVDDITKLSHYWKNEVYTKVRSYIYDMKTLLKSGDFK